MFWAAHWFESTVGLEVALIGREADDLTNDAVLELTGRWLSYRIALRGGWVWLSVCLMDAGEEWEKVFNVGDCSQGWTTMKSFVFALERSGFKSLERPLVVGTLASPNSWVIA